MPRLRPVGQVAVLFLLLLLLVGWAGADDAPAPFATPFFGADGEVRTLVRPEFRDVPSLIEDMKLFGVEGLEVEAIGPWLSPADPKAGQVASRLVLRGLPEIVARGREILRYLDIPKPAVFVSMLVAEVRFTGAQERGGFLDITREVDGAPNSLFRGLYSSFEPESYVRSSLTGYMPYQGTSIRFGNSFDDVFENGAFELVLRMLAERRQAEFLAWPTVLCTEGEPGLVESINATFHRLVRRSGTFVEIGTATTMTGIRLQVVPVRIAKDAAVLDLIADISYEEDERTSAIPASDVVVRRRRVVTRVTVRDRETMLIGGMKLKRRVEREQGLPIVRSTPIIREVASSSGKDCEETEIIVMIRPRIRIPGMAAGPYLPPGEPRRLGREVQRAKKEKKPRRAMRAGACELSPDRDA